MGNRRTRIPTLPNDERQTELTDGSPVDKDSPRIEALGAIEELNSWLGVLISAPSPEELRNTFFLPSMTYLIYRASCSYQGVPCYRSDT